MHVYVFSDGELFATIGFVALLAGFVSRQWTLRRVRKEAQLQGHASASMLAPVQEENQQL